MSRDTFNWAVAALLIVAVICTLKPATSEPISVTVTPMEFELLQLLNAPDESIRLIMAWERAEGSDPSCYNPFNTTLDMPGARILNSHGVRCYADYDSGLTATINTLAVAEYAPIVMAIQQADDEAFISALAVSRWGTDADLVRDIIDEWTVYVQVRAPALPPAPFGQVNSNAIAAGTDPCGTNVHIAIEANNAAISDFTVQPGQTWSFNEAMGDPSFITIIYCAGVPGGNWCNVAARYAQVIRALGQDPVFEDHGADLGGGSENSVLIWNVGGQSGSDGERADLQFTNTLSRPIHIWAIDNEDSVIIAGEVQ